MRWLWFRLKYCGETSRNLPSFSETLARRQPPRGYEVVATATPVLCSFHDLFMEICTRTRACLFWLRSISINSRKVQRRKYHNKYERARPITCLIYNYKQKFLFVTLRIPSRRDICRLVYFFINIKRNFLIARREYSQSHVSLTQRLDDSSGKSQSLWSYVRLETCTHYRCVIFTDSSNYTD